MTPGDRGVTFDPIPLPTEGVGDRARPRHTAVPTGLAPPATDAQALCALMAEVLGVEHVGIEDDFFALGGHSVLAAQLVARARKTLGLQLKLADLINHPSVAQLLRLGDRRTAPQPVSRILRRATRADLLDINRICTITSTDYVQGEHFKAQHVVPLLFAEPFVMVDGAHGFVVEEHGKILGYAIGVVDLPAMHAALTSYVRGRIAGVFAAYGKALVRRQLRWPLRQHRRFVAQMLGCWNVGPAAREMRGVLRRLFSEAHFDARVRDCCHLQVHPDARRKGIGVLLVRAWTEFLREQGAAGVAFNVNRFRSFDELLDSGKPRDTSALLAELGFTNAGGGRWVLRFPAAPS